jgi:hypothetical protein
MNATRVLVAQHQAIAALFDDVAQETRDHAKARAVARIAEELIAHMAGEEEQVLLPRVERALCADALEQLGAEVLASRPPIWIVTTEGHPMPHAEEALRLNARVSLPIPPTHD